ncbi:MAG: hypothetical protein II364_05130 [Bacteroidales bacterium]|nr:hypothetical protein [Bacteroidales bacterium]
MKKKNVTLTLISLCLMCIAIAVGLFYIYKDAPKPEVKNDKKQLETLLEEDELQNEDDKQGEEAEKKAEEAKKAAEIKKRHTDGPFSVLNCATGKVNTLERKNGQLSLTNENGKVLWSIPFETPLCSMAGTIDYYANGKLQFLFISNDEIRLFDRTGKEVPGVRTKLAKPVLTGPAIYDFSGNRKYNILTLNTDNTIDMYNLKGRKPAKWQSIQVNEPIQSLPQYIIRKGKSFWWLRTENNCYLYAFMGGTPLKIFPANTSPADVSF